jgi:hypothetical protein
MNLETQLVPSPPQLLELPPQQVSILAHVPFSGTPLASIGVR